MRQTVTKSPSETKALGRRVAQDILNLSRPKKRAFVIGLEGDLGGGKTTFVQGLARALGIKEKILSPTFVILKKFRIQNPPCLKKGHYHQAGFKSFFHIDCYRIQDSQELLKLGFDKIVLEPENIVVVEWAEKIKDILPKNTILLEFNFVDQNTRIISPKAK